MINLFIINFDGYGEGTGVNTYVKELVNGIVKIKGINLMLVEINRRNNNKTILKDYTKLNISLPEEPSILNNLTEQIKYFKGVAEILYKEMIGKSNIIVHLNWVHKVSFANIIKEIVKCQVILTKHNITWRNYMYDDFEVFLKLNNAIEKSKPILEKDLIKEDIKFYDKIDHIICVAESGKKDMLFNYGFDNNKITLIYNGIKIKSNNQLLKEKNESNLSNGKQEKIILYVGREEKTDSLMYLIRSFIIISKKYKNVRLVVVGNVNQKETLYELCKNYQSIITFTGRIKKSLLQKVYLLADIGIITSFDEQCSYIALEMINYGIPLITTNADGLNDLITDKVTGLKIKLNFSNRQVFLEEREIVKKLHEYLEDDSLRRCVVKNAKTLITKKYSSKIMLKKTITLYNKISNN